MTDDALRERVNSYIKGDDAAKAAFLERLTYVQGTVAMCMLPLSHNNMHAVSCCGCACPCGMTFDAISHMDASDLQLHM
jgi:hypothetical protein